jgi:N-acetyl-gamma-glutamyl-phosphate reductase
MTAASEVSVAVVGATGYVGATAVQLLQRHPFARLTRVTSRTYAGKRMSDVYPGLDLELELAADPDPGGADVVIAALPHGITSGLAPAWLDGGAMVVDIGADFRLSDPRAWQRWYGAPHAAPALLGTAALGLPEIDDGASLPGARLIAVPGCYATAAILGVSPALAGLTLVQPDVIVDAASGTSGSGRAVATGPGHGDADEDFKAYSVGGHRHAAEMEQAFSKANHGAAVRVTFVPHLVPMQRGILATCYLEPLGDVALRSIEEAYQDAYRSTPFVRLVDAPPHTKDVARTNQCHLHVTQQGGKVIVLAALDNLVKGAAGQAVQALNIAMGWPETAGLEQPVRWP